jgi:hypothetical protein
VPCKGPHRTLIDPQRDIGALSALSERMFGVPEERLQLYQSVVHSRLDSNQPLKLEPQLLWIQLGSVGMPKEVTEGEEASELRFQVIGEQGWTQVIDGGHGLR